MGGFESDFYRIIDSTELLDSKKFRAIEDVISKIGRNVPNDYEPVMPTAASDFVLQILGFSNAGFINRKLFNKAIAKKKLSKIERAIAKLKYEINTCEDREFFNRIMIEVDAENNRIQCSLIIETLALAQSKIERVIDTAPQINSNVTKAKFLQGLICFLVERFKYNPVQNELVRIAFAVGFETTDYDVKKAKDTLRKKEQ